MVLVGTVGFEPTTCRLSGATGYKPAALPLSYVPSKLRASLPGIFETAVRGRCLGSLGEYMLFAGNSNPIAVCGKE